MTTARYIIGDTRDVLAAMPDASVDLVLSSPPFLALRSYLPDGHPDKCREIGAEADPGAYIDTLLEVTAEWGRVLAPHGSLCVELGDTYSGGAGGWPLAKSACLIPELYRIGLAYGRNPITGKPSPAGRWRVRNTVRWCRPNPAVGALSDRFRTAVSELVVACRSEDRYHDLDAVRMPYIERRVSRGTTVHGGRTSVDKERKPRAGEDYLSGPGAPPLDYWVIPTHPYKGAHYATWPPELCRIPIEAMSPRQVCTTCGEPRRRIVGDEPTDDVWTDCGHGTWRPGVVLDPFAGSGTTLVVATGHGRDAIGVDIDERNLELARDRIGMFLVEEVHR